MHSSRMRTVRCCGLQGVCPGGVVGVWDVCPRGASARAVSGWGGVHLPPVDRQTPVKHNLSPTTVVDGKNDSEVYHCSVFMNTYFRLFKFFFSCKISDTNVVFRRGDLGTFTTLTHIMLMY